MRQGVSGDRTPRLLMILGDAPFFVTHFMPIAAGAKARGYDVHVAAPLDEGSGRGDRDALKRIETAGYAFHRISLKRAGADPFGELRLIRELAQLLDRIKPSVVHLFGLKPILYAGSIARLKRIPSVCAVIGLGLPFMAKGVRAMIQQTLIRRGFAFAFKNPRCRVTVENEDDGAVVLSTGAVDSARLTRLNGAGVDLSKFRPRREPPHGPPLVMFAARLIAPKGVYDFVEAARRIKARGIAARFVFQCLLDLRNRQAISEEEVRRWHDGGIVEWWGPTADMAEALRRADIFCLPTYYREGLPKVLIEAAASGLPIVTTNVAGCRDIVTDGRNGILIAPRDVDALEAALLALIGDTDLRRRQGEEGRRIAAERFSVDTLVETSLALYGSILAPPPAARSLQAFGDAQIR